MRVFNLCFIALALSVLQLSTGLTIQQFDDIKGNAVLQPQNVTTPPKGSLQTNDIPVKPVGGSAQPNMPDQIYPVDPTYAGKSPEINETVAGYYKMDQTNKTLWGNLTQPFVFPQPGGHPMEYKTPLQEDRPCDPSLIIQVRVPAIEYPPNSTIGFLPRKYGCTEEDEISREKASPEVSWNMVAFDVKDFSLELVSMGGADCPGHGYGAGKILWHVEGIKAAPSITLQEGASHDSRLLNGGKELPNQWLEDYYSGPCPPPGDIQCYRFKVLAHRENGWCQCGFQDFLYTRPQKPQSKAYTYELPELSKSN